MTALEHPPVPPVCNVEAERAVLGTVLLGHGSVLAGLVDAGLCAEDFYREQHGLIWSAMRELHKRGRGVDFLVLAEWLRGIGQLEAVGGQAAIDLLASGVPSVGNWSEYAAIVMQTARWRRALHAAYEIQAGVATRDRGQVRAAVERLGLEWL